MDENFYVEETLDPRDWDAMRSLAHQMVDDALDYLQEVRHRPVWQPIPPEVKDNLRQPAPWEGKGEIETYQEFKRYIFPHPMGNIHPRFWGWVMGNGIPYAVLADMLATTMNPNMAGGEHVANYVERQVLDWCIEMVAFPRDASGILVSGGSMANFVGLAVARNAMAGFDVRSAGMAGADMPISVYASTETHNSNHKAVELLGLGKDWLRMIPVNNKNQISVEALQQSIASDKANGYKPICIIGNAGTVNTGAFDDLNALADICDRENIWFHVDGAFGALAALSDNLRPLATGLERADSLAFDLHKWMYMPFEAACILIRDVDQHFGTFAESADYLTHMTRGLAGDQQPWFSDLGLQLTRNFRALKVWMAVKAYGLSKFARIIDQNVSQAQYLEKQVEEYPNLELLADVPLNIVCFRYIIPGLEDGQLDHLNQEIMFLLHERGMAVPSYTRLDGKFALRVAITNHRSRREDFDFLIAKVGEIAQEIIARPT
jgi:glutamate/tyrosine decarboxylase-like PLP-dependent enzyme